MKVVLEVKHRWKMTHSIISCAHMSKLKEKHYLLIGKANVFQHTTQVEFLDG